ncbi:hypothetical protein J14TS5_63060 [Paenibacillus lautus]|nr:hypothetical protein J14TS5_63060 [Paenibacillus lautus]
MIKGEIRAGADSYLKHVTLYILKQPLSPFTEPPLPGVPFIYRCLFIELPNEGFLIHAEFSGQRLF